MRGLQAVVLALFTRDHDNGNLSSVGVGRDFREDGLSADDGEAKIENDGIRRLAIDHAQRVQPIPGLLNVVPGEPQDKADLAAQIA